MLAKKSFGKLGSRAAARLSTGLEAGLILPGRNVRCLLDNISRKGCRVALDEPPRVGTAVILRIDRTEAFGSIAWVRGKRCGIHFDDPVVTPLLERIRWMAEHMHDHEKSKFSKAGAIWR
jgi:hypothetical protein